MREGKSMKKRVLALLIVLSVVVVGFNVVTGIIQVNQTSAVSGVLTDAQTLDLL